MLKVYDKNLRPIGVLENAYNIGIVRRVNEVWTANFSLPMDDPKVELCSHLNYVEIASAETGKYFGLYRIMPTETSRAIETNRITYELEHVLATLLDDVIDGLLPALINQPTSVQLNRLLNLQSTAHWKLGRVDFDRKFQYSFENENGLLAPILSVPKPFNEPYEFTYDTRTYPWTLNLVRPSDYVKAEVRWSKDMVSFDEVSDPTEIVNYLIPKGHGEGVNQLTIKDVNGGLNYLKDDESIAKWGKRSYIWIDKRFKDAQSLKESGQSLLDQWKEPKIAFTVGAVDLSVLPQFAHEKRELNAVTRIVVEDKFYYGRILEEKIGDLAKEFEVDYQISNKLDDIATTQADVERKQQVNDAYSQGATNILAFSYQDNADKNVPGLISFFIDDDVVNINTCELTFRTRPFRAYSRATKGGGATVKSTKGGGATTESTTSGGATTATSSSGGGTSKSTESGGATTRTSSNAVEVASITGVPENSVGDENWGYHVHEVRFPGHSHSIDIPAHSHNFTVPAHTHSVTIPNHSHSVSIPSHTHEIELPDHTHDVKHEIIELSDTPTTVTIKVDGNTVSHTEVEADRLDIVPYLGKDNDGKITRGRHEVTITPNGLGRIEADLILRVFIQSQLGGVY